MSVVPLSMPNTQNAAPKGRAAGHEGAALRGGFGDMVDRRPARGGEREAPAARDAAQPVLEKAGWAKPHAGREQAAPKPEAALAPDLPPAGARAKAADGDEAGEPLLSGRQAGPALPVPPEPGPTGPADAARAQVTQAAPADDIGEAADDADGAVSDLLAILSPAAAPRHDADGAALRNGEAGETASGAVEDGGDDPAAGPPGQAGASNDNPPPAIAAGGAWQIEQAAAPAPQQAAAAAAIPAAEQQRPVRPVEARAARSTETERPAGPGGPAVAEKAATSRTPGAAPAAAGAATASHAFARDVAADIRPAAAEVRAGARDDGQAPARREEQPTASAGTQAAAAEQKVSVVSLQVAPAPAVPVQAAGLSQTAAGLVGALVSEGALPTYMSEAAAAGFAAAADARPVTTLRIQLHPVDLGTVTVKLSGSGEELAIEVQVETSEARHRLAQDSEAIMRSLRGLGYEIDRINIQHVSTPVQSAAPGQGGDRGSAFSAFDQRPGERGDRPRGGGEGGQEGRRDEPAKGRGGDRNDAAGGVYI